MKQVIELNPHYAIGDVHGCYNELKNMYSLIQNDWKILSEKLEYKNTKPTIVMIGDYIDRGPDSNKVIDFLINRSEQDTVFNWIFLKGNHEDLMYTDINNWMWNGGRETVNSYIKNSTSFYEDFDVLNLIGSRHNKFFQELKYYHKVDKLVFVHAGLIPSIKIENHRLDDVIWNRDYIYYDGEYVDGNFVVHGHTPYNAANGVDIRRNKVNIDGGCVYKNSKFPGILIGVRIDDPKNPKVDMTFKV